GEGELEYLGRIDKQVKIRGFRIETGEIESWLARHQDIKEAVVLAKKDKSGDTYLCAYIVSDRNFQASRLREYLLTYLPGYMIPSYFVHLPRIPLTVNGKVDRNALPEPGPGIGEEYEAPAGETEEKLTNIWSEILGIGKNTISATASFFEVGGHSLKAAILISKLHKECNVKVPLVEVFRTPTIRELARYIKKAAKADYSSVQPLEKKEYYPLSSAQKRLYFLQQLDPGGTGYNMPMVLAPAKDIDKSKLELFLKQLIARHESLRTSFTTVKEILILLKM
ncbi:MAG: hypothetical protein GY940_34905, partial [bacterium]|nr:hypothetical protein [bacterium]